MATSGTVSYSVTKDEIITEALEQLGVVEAGESVTSADITSCTTTLNMLVKTWQTIGLDVFTIARHYVFLEENKHEYTLDETGDHFTTSYTDDSLGADAASGAATVTLDDASSASDGDNIGIYQDDATMHWTTINGVPAGNVVTLTAVTTAAAASGNLVRFYTNKAPRPMQAITASVRNSSDNERPIFIISRTEWSELTAKTGGGTLTQIFYDPQVRATSPRVPNLFTWQEVSDPRDMLIIWMRRTIEDFTASTDNPDFPQQWYFPLAFNLAVAIGPKFGIPAINPNFKEVKEQAIFWLESAKDYDGLPEDGVQMQPSIEGWT